MPFEIAGWPHGEPTPVERIEVDVLGRENKPAFEKRIAERRFRADSQMAKDLKHKLNAAYCLGEINIALIQDNHSRMSLKPRESVREVAVVRGYQYLSTRTRRLDMKWIRPTTVAKVALGMHCSVRPALRNCVGDSLRHAFVEVKFHELVLLVA